MITHLRSSMSRDSAASTAVITVDTRGELGRAADTPFPDPFCQAAEFVQPRQSH